MQMKALRGDQCNYYMVKSSTLNYKHIAIQLESVLTADFLERFKSLRQNDRIISTPVQYGHLR